MGRGPQLERTRNYELTGRVKFEAEPPSLFRRQAYVILCVEETYYRARYDTPLKDENDYNWRVVTRWRPADAMDISHPKLRWLIDGPHSIPDPPPDNDGFTL